MHMVEKILNNTTPYGKIRASHEGSLHSSTLRLISMNAFEYIRFLVHATETVTLLIHDSEISLSI